MAIKTRSEAQERYTWNFTDIFPSDEAWEQALKDLEASLPESTAIQGTLGESAESMKHGLDVYFEISRRAELVYVYSMLRLNVDNGDPVYQAMNGRAEHLLVKLSTAGAFLVPEILSIEEEKLCAMMQDPVLAGYRHQLEDIARKRAHTLDAKSERMLAMLSDAAGTASTTSLLQER